MLITKYGYHYVIACSKNAPFIQCGYKMDAKCKGLRLLELTHTIRSHIHAHLHAHTHAHADRHAHTDKHALTDMQAHTRTNSPILVHMYYSDLEFVDNNHQPASITRKRPPPSLC